MGCPQIVNAWHTEVAGGKVQAVQKHGTRYVIVEADFPAVVTVPPGALKLRYPNGARLINIYRSADAVEKWDATELVGGSALKPLVERLGQDFPQERERGTRLRGTPGEMALAAAEALGGRV
jgi:electron transfer flavoprotein alpha/beta subunit